MPLALLPGGFAGWYGTAALLWAVAVVLGLARRRGRVLVPSWLPLDGRQGRDGPLLPLSVGAGSGLLLLAAIAGGNGAVRLPLPWFLGAAGVEGIADPLSRWFLGIIGLVGIAATLFSPGYFHHLRQRIDLGFVWAAMALLMVSMSAVVLAANGVVFLVAW